MDKRIEFVTHNERRTLPVVVAGLLVLTGVGVGSIVLLREAPAALAVGVPLGLILGAVYGLVKLLNKLGAEPLVVQLGAEGLSIHNQKTQAEQRVRYEDIAAYRFSTYNQTDELRLTLKDAGQVILRVNARQHHNQGLADVLRELEHRLTVQQERQPERSPATLREKSFFEKPFSTVLLVVISAVMAWLTWMVFASPQPVKGSVFTSYAFYLSYVAAWYAARERRAAKA